MSDKISVFEKLSNLIGLNKSKGNKKFGIRKKLLLSSVSTLVIVAFLIGSISVMTNTKSIKASIESSLQETVETTSWRVSNQLEVYRTLATEIAGNDTFRYMTSGEAAENKEEMTAKMTEQVNRIYEMHPDVYDMVILDINGKDLISGLDLSDRQYFIDTKEKKVALTNDIVINREDNKQILVTSAPIIVNGQVQGVIGIITDATVLSDIASSLAVGESGETSIVNASGTDIGNSNHELVKEEFNVIEQSNNNKELEGLANIYRDMIAGSHGFKEYENSGEERFIAYTPINDTNGWSIGISVDKAEFMQASIDGTKIMIICTIGALGVAILITSKSANNIVNPIIACVDRIKLLAEGDLSSPVPTVDTNDEIKVLADATNDLVHNISEIIYDVDNVLASISNGDLTVTTQANYIGEFVSMKNSSDNIVKSLNEVMVEIALASEQVASGANQVSIGAQSLAQGSTEQASSVEELSATIIDVSNKINSSSENANKANDIVKQTGDKMKSSNSQMSEMMEAIELINLKSNEISKIIKTIDDIAFQTNILALNAAVEAARAGQAGKGFAVVADEVRNLSVKSADAARNTTMLIEETVNSINVGSSIAKDTAKSLEGLVYNTNLVTEIVDKISSELTDQSIAVSQITESIELVNSVVQSNSATSEESAAASEELTGQSYAMNELISRFKLSSEDKDRSTYDELSF